MAWTSAETQRITTLEEVVNDLQIAVANLMSKTQMRQLLLVKQREVEALTTRIEALESQLTLLQGSLD